MSTPGLAHATQCVHRGRRRTIAACIVSGAVTALAFAYCPVPWSATLLALAVLLLTLATVVQRTGPKLVLIYATSVCVALALFEGYLGLEQRRGDGTHMAGSITEGFTHADDTLGYAPDANRRVTARKLYGDQVLYDVTYTIGPDGLRVAPPVQDAPVAGCVAFFGDSVSFGEGVNDDQTFPYLVGLKTAGRYRIYNFAFSGYGPHQMLAALQAGLVERLVSCRSTHFIYLTIAEHIARVAGLASWDKHGPRFKLDPAGAVVRDGHFDDPGWLWGLWVPPGWVTTALERFFTWQKLFGRAREPRAADLTLFLAVIREAARLAQAKYPASDFLVILWDGRDDTRLGTIALELQSAGMAVRRLTSAIPDFRSHWLRYILSVHDPHPNQLQHELLAADIVSHVLTR